MSNEQGRKGGGKKNQAGGREHDAMAMTDKSLNSYYSIGHLCIDDNLQAHSVKQKREHTDKVLARKGRPRKSKGGEQPEDTKPVDLQDEEDDRKVLLVEDQRLIVGRRLYDRRPDGTPVGKNAASDEFMARHSEFRRERNSYLDRDGTHVEAGKVIRERKGRYLEEPKMLGGERDRDRRAPGVMKSILARLMPHEALTAADELSGELLDAAMDRAVTEFQSAIGCEIISAVVHRMSDHDLHIHIQYSMVVAQEKPVGKHSNIRKEWDAEASRLAREALHAVKVDDPNPSAIGAMIKKLMKEGRIQPPPTVQIVFRKIRGRRFLGKGNILGYSFRHKLNLTRLAQEAGDDALGQRVTDMKDDRRGFAPIAVKTDQDLEKKYLDVWLERTWRNSVKEFVSQELLEKMKYAGVQAAKDYADYGTSMPEAFDLEQKKVELEYEAAQNEWDRQFLDYENERYRAELEENAKLEVQALESRTRAHENELLESQKRLDAQKATLDEREGSLRNREESIKDVQKVAEEARQQAESLRAKVAELKDKADLFDRLAEFWRQILDTPGLGLLLKKFTKVWQKLKEFGPELGIVTMLEAIEAVKDRQSKPTQPNDRNIH